MVGSERPFIQVSRSLPTDAGVRDQVVQYRDVGTSLTIIPTINDDGYVNLQVIQEVSTATAEEQFGAPTLSTREASTQLFVRDGQTVVIGGLMQDLKSERDSMVPFLGEMPFFGKLFRQEKDVIRKSELVILLRPIVVGSETWVGYSSATQRSINSLSLDSSSRSSILDFESLAPYLPPAASTEH